MTGSTLTWFAVAMLMTGVVLGLILGVIIDRDNVYNQIFKKLKIKKGTGSIIIDTSQIDEAAEKKGIFERLKERRDKRKIEKQS